MFSATHMMMDTAMLATAMSPTKTCKVRVSSTRYRNDPYRARVASALKPVTPVFRGKIQVKAPKAATFVPPPALKPIDAPALAARASAPTRPPSPVNIVAPATPLTNTKSAGGKKQAKQAKKSASPVVAPLAAAPKAAAAPAADHWVRVGFKHETTMFQAPFRVSVGDAVIVQGDRGEHVGVVQSITTTKPAHPVPYRVLRHANVEDMARAEDLASRESDVAASIQKLAESFGLGIRVVDVEFQLDMNKLQIYFASKVYVDFRKLQRSLFREFRCRIWLTNWDEVRAYAPVPVNPLKAL